VSVLESNQAVILVAKWVCPGCVPYGPSRQPEWPGPRPVGRIRPRTRCQVSKSLSGKVSSNLGERSRRSLTKFMLTAARPGLRGGNIFFYKSNSKVVYLTPSGFCRLRVKPFAFCRQRASYIKLNLHLLSFTQN